MKQFRFVVPLVLLAVVSSGCRPDSASRETEAVLTEDAPHADVEGILPGSEITITGRLISTLCFSADDPAEYDTSLECATSNTAQGLPVAVHETEKAVTQAWILVTVPQIFTDYMHRNVRVKGEVRSKGVLVPTRVELETDDGWTFIM